MNTLECPDSITLYDFLLGQLEEATVDQFEAHLADCEDCLTACGSLAAGDELTFALHGRDFQPPHGLELPASIAELIPRLQQLDVRFTEDTGEPNGIDVRILLSAAVEADEIGRFAGYRVLKYLGQGGMGIVFAAEDPHLRRQVALKILNPVLAASRIACRRFERETQAAAGFEHDHIITIYHVGEEGGLPFMAMQLLEGESLQDRLDWEGTLTDAETLRIGKEIANGLTAAHQRGLLHRDIKPDNIWVQSDGGRVKILDFGLARLAGSESRLTDFGSVIGTPDYMAPEQAMGTEVDERCDLFSLGSLLYRCVTGETPFRRDTAVATLVAVNEHAAPAAAEVSDCSAELSDFIARLMRKQATDRPESAAFVSTQLSELIAGNAISQPNSSQIPPRYRTWLVASAAAAAAAAAALLLAIIIQITTNKGTLTVEVSDDEYATTVQGETLLIREVSTGKQIKVRLGENSVSPGEYEIQVQNLPDGITFSAPRFCIFRGGEKQVEVTFQPKAVAKVLDAKPESNGTPHVEDKFIASQKPNREKSTTPNEIKLLVKDRHFPSEDEVLQVTYDDIDLLKVLNMHPVPVDATQYFPQWLKALDGQRIRIRGFMYPAFEVTGMKSFTLVRDNEICCFKKQPTIYDIIKINMAKDTTTDFVHNMPVDVEGVFQIVPKTDDNELFQLYRITDANVQPATQAPFSKAAQKSPIVVVKSPPPKLPANTRMSPYALVPSPIKLPGVQSWTIEAAEESMPLSRPSVSSDGQWIAAPSWNGSVRVWKTDSPDKPQILCDHVGNVGTVSWSPNRKYLATSSRSPNRSGKTAGRILVRNTDDFRVSYEIPTTAGQIAWSPSGRQLAFTSSIDGRATNSALWVFDTVTEAVSKTNMKFFAWANIKWSSDSQLLAVTSNETVKILDADSLRLRSTLDVNAVDFRWDTDSRELCVQSVPRGLGQINVGADNDKSVSQFRFEKWNVDNKTVISTQDKTLIGKKGVCWNDKGQPQIVDYPESADSPKDALNAASSSGAKAIQIRQVFGDGSIALPALPFNSDVPVINLEFSDNSRQVFCITASGLYLIDRSGQNKNWQRVAGLNSRPWTYYHTSNYDNGTVRLASTAQSVNGNSGTVLVRDAELDIESLNLTVKDATLPVEQFEAVDPADRFVAELKISSSEESLGRQLLYITEKSRPDGAPQEFLLPEPSKAHGRHVPKWSSDGQFLAAVVKRRGAYLRLFGLDETGQKFVPIPCQTQTVKYSGESLVWAPQGHLFARTTFDAGPVVVDLKAKPAVTKLPLDPELFRPPPARNRGGSSPSGPQASFFLWVDSQTLFGSVSGSAKSGGRQKQVCYLWRKTADGWSIAQRFDGYAINIAMPSPDKTRIVFGPERPGYQKTSGIKIADLNNGLVRTIPFKSVESPDHRYREVLGWVDKHHLWINFAKGSESYIGSFSLLNGQTNVFPKSGYFALIPDGFCRFVRNELQFYDRYFRLSSSIVISSNERAAAVFPDGQLKVNADDPCSMLYVALLDDGTQVTLTPGEFKQRFGKTLPETFFDKASIQSN